MQLLVWKGPWSNTRYSVRYNISYPQSFQHKAWWKIYRSRRCFWTSSGRDSWTLRGQAVPLLLSSAELINFHCRTRKIVDHLWHRFTSGLPTSQQYEPQARGNKSSYVNAQLGYSRSRSFPTYVYRLIHTHSSCMTREHSCAPIWATSGRNPFWEAEITIEKAQDNKRWFVCYPEWVGQWRIWCVSCNNLFLILAANQGYQKTHHRKRIWSLLHNRNSFPVPCRISVNSCP